MARRKVQRWRSRPSDKRRSKAYATYPKPEDAEVFKLQSELVRTHPQQRAESENGRPAKAPHHPHSAQIKHKKRNYHSAPGSKANGGYSSRQSAGNRAQRIKRKKRSNTMLRAAVLAAFLVVGVTISMFIFFKIGEIQVTGSEKYTPAQIIEASEIELGDNLFSPSSAITQKRVSRALPYVKGVQLHHRLPDVLIINVTESSAKFAFKASTKFLLTDEDLKLLEISDKLPHGAAVIEGVGLKGAELGENAQFKDTQKGEIVSQLFAQLEKNKLGNLTAINVSNLIDISVVYDDRITILFGQADALEYKCALAAKAIENAQEDNENIEGTINVKQADETKQAYFNPNS